LSEPGASPPPAPCASLPAAQGPVQAHVTWLARTVVAPIVFGAVTVSLGTLGYILFCPGIAWTLSGRADHSASFLIVAALVGGLAGAALGLCVAADRAARESSGPVAAGAGVGGAPRRRAARRLRRPPVRYGRERRRLCARSGSTSCAAGGAP
jgi:hypothetical protein